MGQTLILFSFLGCLNSLQANLYEKELDSLQQQYILATTTFDKAIWSAKIAEVYSIAETYPDSAIAYLNIAYQTLNNIQDRPQKEKAYAEMIETVIWEMNVDSFAKAALQYIEDPEQKARVYLILGSDYYLTKPEYNQKWCLEVMDTVAQLLEGSTNEELVFRQYLRARCYFRTNELLQGSVKLPFWKTIMTLLKQYKLDIPIKDTTLSFISFQYNPPY